MAGDLSRLHRLIVEHFDLEELRTLAFDLDVRYDDLAGAGLSARARELVLHLGRRDRLDALLAALQRARPEAFSAAGFTTDAATLEALYAQLDDVTGLIPIGRLDRLRDVRIIGALALGLLLLVGAALVLRLLLFGSPGPAPAGVAASIISYQPQVEVKRDGTDRLIPAAFGLDLFSGDVVNTYEGAAVNIVCENGVLFKLPERSNLRVDCRATDDPRVAGRLDPDLGALSLSPAVTFTLASESIRAPRSQQDQLPLLLRPRNTVITDTRPTFYWQPVSGAGGYRLSLSLPGGVAWNREATATHLRYPADAPPLELGGAIVVTLVTQDDETARDVTLLRLLDASGQADLARAEAAIRALDLDQTAQAYLLARLYHARGLLSAAIAQLEWLAAGGTTSASLSRQLGDLYFEIGLFSRAEEAYRAALSAAGTADDASAQAAAHVGLARVAHAFDEIAAALDHLQTAEALYRQVGETEQAELAAAERARLKE